MMRDLHFLILTCLRRVHGFSLPLNSEAVTIDELGSIAPGLRTCATFFLLNFVFQKLQVVVGYRFFFFFFFCVVYVRRPRGRKAYAYRATFVK